MPTDRLSIATRNHIIDKYGMAVVENKRQRLCLLCTNCMMSWPIPYWCKHFLLPVTTTGDACPYFLLAGQAEPITLLPMSAMSLDD